MQHTVLFRKASAKYCAPSGPIVLLNNSIFSTVCVKNKYANTKKSWKIEVHLIIF